MEKYQPPDVRHVELQVLFADGEIVVVAKPAELLSCPGTTTVGFDSVVARVRVLFPAAEGPLLVHRLDQPTSGVMVVALTSRSQRTLSAAFAGGRVAKAYVAVVIGDVAGEEGEIRLPLRLDWPRRPLQIVDEVRGKTACTRWRVLAREPNATRVALEPRTGRTHQLRVHCADPRGLGTPIRGDRLYGGAGPGERLHLHAESLEFDHPVTRERLTFVTPAPF